MALVPARGGSGGVGILSTLDSVRNALRPLKAALDERDSWELLAAADEKAQMAAAASSVAQPTSVGAGRGGRGGRSGTRRNKKFKGDLSYDPGVNTPPSYIPKSIGNQVVWTKARSNPNTFTASTSAAVEQNYFCTASQHPQISSWTALFDQYCIVMFSVTLEWNIAPGSTAATMQIYSALDFDNVGSISTVAAIEAYGSCKVQNVKYSGRTSRSCRPCVGEYAGSSSASTIERRWMDCAYTSVPHYGIRFIADKAGAAFVAQAVQEMVIAFRMKI